MKQFNYFYRMHKNVFLTAFFFLNVATATSQNLKISRWEVNLIGGISNVLGDFRRIDKEKVIAYDKLNGRPYENGFPRAGNSAAKNGYYVGLEGKYYLTQKINLSLRLTRSNNKVNTQTATDYLNTILPEGNSDIANPAYYYYYLSANDYDVSCLTFGIQYSKTVRKVRIELGPFIGFSTLAFPGYSNNVDVLLVNTGNTLTLSNSDLTDQPSSNSPVFGSDLSICLDIGRYLFIGADFRYSYADFFYSTTLGRAGINPATYSDEISYRVLNIGIKSGFRF